jgi:hypothetical protein
MKIWCTLQVLQHKDFKLPKVITKETALKAEELRAAGFAYKKIASMLEISEIWCKKNLKHVENKLKKKYEVMYTKSKTNSGISKSEIGSELNIYSLPEQEVSKSMNSAVRRIRSNNKQNVVRPDWMLPEAARFMTDSVVRVSMDIEDRCHEEAYYLYSVLKEYTDPSKHNALPSVRKIKSAMIALTMAAVSTQKNSGTKLSSWLESLYRTANVLEQRNTDTKVMLDKKNTEQQNSFADLEEYIL